MGQRAFASVAPLFLLGIFAPCARVEAAPRQTVVVLRPEGPYSSGAAVLVDEIKKQVTRVGVEAPEVFVESMDVSSYPSDGHERQLVALYRERYGNLPVTLVIAIAEQPLDFALRHRSELFATASVLFGLIEPQQIESRTLPANVTGVFIADSVRPTLDIAVALHPSARRIVVISGTSRADRAWESMARDDLRTWTSVPVTYMTDLPLKELLGELALLDRDTIVYFLSMTRDGAGAALVSQDVVALIRQVTTVPIYGLGGVYLGRGAVGGAAIDFTQHGTDLGGRARMLLGGARAVDLPAVTSGITLAFDARELSRFGIREAALPAGAVVQFGVPGVWQRWSPWSAPAAAVALIVVALVGTLGAQTRIRRRLAASLGQQRKFRTAVSDVVQTGAKGPVGSPASVDASLLRVADAMGMDDVWLWQSGDPSDPDWSHDSLRSGEPVAVSNIDELPRPMRERMILWPSHASVLATPLDADGAALGALFWISCRPRVAWSPDEVDRFKVISTLVAGEMQRRRSSQALQHGDALKDAILSSLPARIAVLDRGGTIIAVNASWTEAKWPSAGRDRIEPGANFFDLCRTAAREGCRHAADMADCVAEVCEGRRAEYELEYYATDADADRWFLMKATPLKQDDGGAVVTHTDITERKRAELLVRENEERFRRLADALPVGVWMSSADGARVHFNDTWLDMTGRPIERELGVGWLEAVHPDDRERCMGTYLRAFAARQPFSMEYRIRRHDGHYRWLLDKGVPRYDLDTAFAGYLGGATDFTVQREAEQTLRELSGKLIAAQEDERRRIARDLHDSVGQRMALVSIRLYELGQRLRTGADVSAIVGHLQHDSEVIGRELHSLSHRLHSAKLDALGLVGAIASECREMSEHGVLVQFAATGVRPVSSDVELCLFRIVQAALSNVVKHSGASSAQVTITGDRHLLVLTVKDGGVGFVADQRVEGLGLVSIRERVRSIGGELTVRSALGQGTVIEARVPVKSYVAASSPPSLRNLSSRRFVEHSPPPFLSDTSRTAPG